MAETTPDKVDEVESAIAITRPQVLDLDEHRDDHEPNIFRLLELAGVLKSRRRKRRR